MSVSFSIESLFKTVGVATVVACLSIGVMASMLPKPGAGMMAWHLDCGHPDDSLSAAMRFAQGATLLMQRGDTHEARDAYVIAAQTALGEFNVERRLYESVCVARQQAGAGFRDDSKQTLVYALADAQAYWAETEPAEVLTPVNRLLAVAHALQELGDMAESTATASYAVEMIEQVTPDLTAASALMSLAQYFQVSGAVEKADEKFKRAREMLLAFSNSGADSAADSGIDADRPHPSLVLSALALEQAKVGRFDAAQSDLEQAVRLNMTGDKVVAEALAAAFDQLTLMQRRVSD